MNFKTTYPAWAPRFWHGMLWTDWFELLRRHRYRVHPLRWGLATTVTGLTAFNSLMRVCNRSANRQRLAQAKLVDDPIFIVGHWRSGTTYLHELMACDHRLATPTTYQCFAAHHFLLTESWVPRLFWFIMPARRPMDNVRTGWDSPQEDEFALCSLGVRSPYLRIAFPNDPMDYLDYLDLQSLSPETLRRWQQSLREFLLSLTLATNRRLILKSPTHTARIGLLAEMFPQARFLHIVRNPLSIFPSTMQHWQVLDEAQGLQVPHHRQLKTYVLSAFKRMYAAFDQQRPSLRSDQIFDLRYEDLVREPIQTLRAAYEQLQLGDFSVVQPHLEERVRDARRYQTNRYDLDAQSRDEILHHWRSYAERYGYLDAS
jgi:hypothetical protein